MDITIRQMYDANMHFGHQARFWNPKMKPYIYGEFGRRNKIHIINLDKALPLLKGALKYVRDMAARGGTMMIVSTRNVTAGMIQQESERCGMPYANYRWLGGTLTNFSAVRRSVEAYRSLKTKEERGDFERMNKKEAVSLRRKLRKMERLLGGMVAMERPPDALFIIDVGYERNALNEAVSLGIPVVAVVDSNNSYENVDYMIPGNDDAISAVKFYIRAIADAVMEGRAEYKANADADESMELGAVSGEGPAKTDKAEARAKRKASAAKGEAPAAKSEKPAGADKDTETKKDGE